MPAIAKILIVDDGETIRQVTAMILRRAGYEVECAKSDEEAREIITRFVPDLLLPDVNLGNKDGRDFCREIKANPHTANIFIILISGRLTSASDRVIGFDAGADAYLSRPVSNAELLAQINALIRIRLHERARELHHQADQGLTELSLLNAKAQVEETLRANAVMLSNLSTEIRNLVSSMIGSVKALENEGHLSAGQKKHLDAINASGERLESLCSDCIQDDRPKLA